MSETRCSTHFDPALSAIPGLRGLPWIGLNYPALAPQQRLLIVGESHYINPDNIPRDQGNRYTRDMVHETFLTKQWTTKTLTAISHLLFPHGYQRAPFWENTCYYNFVQRVMGNLAERPTGTDFVNGWTTFLQLIQLIKPTHCLFIGVSAANHFNWALSQLKATSTPVAFPGKVGRTHGRAASITLDTHTVNLHFIKHSGKYFSAAKWNAYLQQHAPSMMSLMDNPAYQLTTAQAA